MSTRPNILIRFWNELKRRKVSKVLAMYAGSAFVIIQVTDILTNRLNLPPWIATLVIIILSIGFPITAILAWVFDLTPEGIKKTESLEELAGKEIMTPPARRKLKVSDVVIFVLAMAVIILVWPKIFNNDTIERLKSSGNKLSIAVMPFRNVTNDTSLNFLKDAIQFNLISALSNSSELKVRQKEQISALMKAKGITDDNTISSSFAEMISRKLDADIFIYGNIQKSGQTIRLNAQLIESKTKDVLKSIEIEGPYNDDKLLAITDSLRKRVTDFLLISKLIKENPLFGRIPVLSKSPDAIKFFIKGNNLKNTFLTGEDLEAARDWFLRSLAADSDFYYPMEGLEDVYSFMGKGEESLKWLMKCYSKMNQWPIFIQNGIRWRYANSFEAPEVQIKYLKEILEDNDQIESIHWLLGNTYSGIGDYENAIPELEKAVDLMHNYGEDNGWFYRDLGLAYNKTGQFGKERKLYRKAGKYLKDDADIIRCRTVMALTLKDTVRAGKLIKKYMSICRKKSSSDSDIDGDLGWTYWQAEMHEKAEEYFRKASLLDPGDPGKMNTLAMRLIDMNKDFDEAYVLLDKAMEKAPTKGDYYGYMDSKGCGLLKQGRNREALELFQNLYDTAPYKFYYLKEHLEAAKKAVRNQGVL